MSAATISTDISSDSEMLPFHSLADAFPLIEGDDFDELVADIKAHGLIEPIVLLDGRILDGRNRYRACLAAGTEPKFRQFTGDDPVAYVVSSNIHRRHLCLSAEQKRSLIAKLLKANPEKSDRQVAKLIKVSTDKTVGAVRCELERRAEIPHAETRTDTEGRKQPARRGWSRERYLRHKAKKRGRQSDDAEKPTRPLTVEHTDPEASAEAMKAQQAALDDTPDDERWADKPDAKELEKRRDQFLKNAGAALGYGQVYDGPVDAHVVKTATAIRDTWIEMVDELKERLDAGPLSWVPLYERQADPGATDPPIALDQGPDDDGLDIPDYLRRTPTSGAAAS
jgi:hypothetical protein